MELNELDAHERTVLAAGLRLTIMADDRASAAEAVVIDRVAQALGQAEYEAAMDRAAQQAADSKSFATLSATVTRGEARELIYGTLLEAALADSISPGDGPLLEDLARLWGLNVTITGADEELLPGTSAP